MCSEKAQTDSFFVYEISNHIVSTIRSCQNNDFIQQVFKEETLAQQDCAAFIKNSARRVTEKTGRQLSVELSYVDILPSSKPFISTASDKENCPEAHSNTIIVSYIHLKDGKKA